MTGTASWMFPCGCSGTRLMEPEDYWIMFNICEKHVYHPEVCKKARALQIALGALAPRSEKR